MPSNPTWLQNYWSSLLAIIAATWPEMENRTYTKTVNGQTVTVPIAVVRRDVAQERANWVDLIKTGQLSSPWVVVKIEWMPTTEWGLGPKYLVQTTVWYIVDTGKIASSGVTQLTTIETKIDALRVSLLNDVTLGTTLDEIEIDSTAENPVNETYLVQQVPYQAASLTFQTVVCSVTAP